MTGLRESCETSMQDSLTSKSSLNAGIREFKQIGTAGADTAAGSKFPPK